MFPEISLHVLDIAENSIKAGASRIRIEIAIDTEGQKLSVAVKDNGCGMDCRQLARCMDPFFTSRTTRRVGLGIPFLKQSAECTGGSFQIRSQEGVGTELAAEYRMGHIDCIPLGDINATIYSLVLMNEAIDFYYRYCVDGREFVLDTKEMRALLGEVPFGSSEVAAFIREYLDENKKEADQEEIL